MVLEAKAAYQKNVKSHSLVNGKQTTKTENVTRKQTQEFNCTKTMPKIFNESEAGTVFIKILNQTANPQTRVYAAPNLDTVKIGFMYNGSQSNHTIRVGVIEKSRNNVEYVNMSKMDFWENVKGTGISGNTLVISKALNPQTAADQITVMYYDVYGNEQEAERYNVTEKTHTGELETYFNPVLIILIIMFGTLSYATFKNFMFLRRRW